jgi:hypothetical protein
VDRSLLFAIVALALLAGGLLTARNHAGPIANEDFAGSGMVR